MQPRQRGGGTGAAAVGSALANLSLHRNSSQASSGGSLSSVSPSSPQFAHANSSALPNGSPAGSPVSHSSSISVGSTLDGPFSLSGAAPTHQSRDSYDSNGSGNGLGLSPANSSGDRKNSASKKGSGSGSGGNGLLHRLISSISPKLTGRASAHQMPTLGEGSSPSLGPRSVSATGSSADMSSGSSAGDAAALLPRFPPKKLFGNMSAAFVEQRYQQLCRYVSQLSSLPAAQRQSAYLQFFQLHSLSAPPLHSCGLVYSQPDAVLPLNYAPARTRWSLRWYWWIMRACCFFRGCRCFDSAAAAASASRCRCACWKRFGPKRRGPPRLRCVGRVSTRWNESSCAAGAR